MLKVVPVQLHNGKKTLNTYAVLDDGSERTIILPAAVQYRNLKGKEELLSLRTIRQDNVQLKGPTVSLKVSPLERKGMKHDIQHAFTAAELDLAEQSCAAGNLLPTLERRSIALLQQGQAHDTHWF